MIYDTVVGKIVKLYENIMKVDNEKWDDLIEKHYLSVCNRKEPPFKWTRGEMKEWWYNLVEKKVEINGEKGEEEIELYIKGITHTNNNGFFLSSNLNK